MAEGFARLCKENFQAIIYVTIFSVFLIVFVQSLYRKSPTISIEEIYIPALDRTTTGINTTAAIAATTTTAIYFHLKLENKNPVGLLYRNPMNLTFSYFPNKSTSTVYTLSGFHQGHHKEKHIRDVVVVAGMAAAAGGGRRVVVRVDLVGKIKFKSIAQWKRTLAVGADVEIDNSSGEKVQKTGIKLVHSGAVPATATAALLLSASCVFMVMFL